VLTGSGKGSILVIRDSYADSFAPYLSENYATVDLVDMRYFRTGIDNLIAQNNYDEILILYNFQTFASDENLIWLNING
ncbi:MAG: hypothetical protein PHG02_03510, partial [Oscillospiraceae bacterium]|nr:hypothetical protein [Oscillospiraceae bacterium]